MTTRIAALTALVLAGLASGTWAAQPAAPAPTRDAAPAVADERTARETRDRLHQLLNQYPPAVAEVLRLDPALLTMPDYLAPYPTLAAFLAQHPDVAHSPMFFLGDARLSGADGSRKQALDALKEILAGCGLFLAFLTMVSLVVWLAREGIGYRRWLRATRIQTDAHMKLVDRLTSNEDLVAYVQSPAGQRFLSSPPVTLDGGPHTVSAPLNRILWSVQAGVVLATAGLGLWFAKSSVIDELAQPIFVIAILAIAIGVGFVISALLSYALSRQLGLVNAPSPHA
jgi:hypothetical protein